MSERVDLWNSPAERAIFDDMAELYAILRTTELLETAYTRDAVEKNEYLENLQRLLTQFKNTEKALLERGAIDSLAGFVYKYQLDCPKAMQRMTQGMPDEVGKNEDNNKAMIGHVRDMTELFIYCSNLISMGRTAVDELRPQLEQLLKKINKVKSLIPQYDPVSIEKWIKQMEQMRASEQLDEDAGRQLLYDLNNAKASIDDLLNQN